MPTVSVKVKVPGIDAMLAQVSGEAISKDVADAWSILYRSFMRQRFTLFSRGGGDWPPLKPSTIKRRRKGKGKGSPAILRDTGALFASLEPSVSGGILQQSVLNLGLKIILGGSKRYSDGPTLAQVASYHHHGKGHLPKREILVKPDAKTLDKMGAVLKKIVVKHLKEA